MIMKHNRLRWKDKINDSDVVPLIIWLGETGIYFNVKVKIRDKGFKLPNHQLMDLSNSKVKIDATKKL